MNSSIHHPFDPEIEAANIVHLKFGFSLNELQVIRIVEERRSLAGSRSVLPGHNRRSEPISIQIVFKCAVSHAHLDGIG